MACAFLSKPELLYSLLDQETLKYIHEKHPGLWEVAVQLAAAVHEERPTKSSASNTEEGEVPNPFAYNLDEMSDEEEEDEDMETGAPAQGRAGGARRSLGDGITADQLASAIASAQSALGMASTANPVASGSSGGMGGMTGFTSSRPPTSAAPESSQGSASSSRMITQNQLAEALRLACGGAFGATPGSSSTPAATSTAPPANFDTQMATMRDFGIVDERLATRALQIMGGDVQAAIDLIYSGWSGEDDSAN